MSIPANNRRTVFVVSRDVSPTLEYWKRGIEKVVGEGKYIYVSEALEAYSIRREDVIVFIRVIPVGWFTRLYRLRRMGVGVKLFIDDGIHLKNGRRELPIGYAIKLRLEWLKQRYIFGRMIEEIVVSTNVLGESIRREYGTRIAVSKAPLIPQKEEYETKKRMSVVYCGTSSHVSEFRWLEILIQKLELVQLDIMIEVVASERWRRRLRKYSNVVLLYPMKWNEFKLYSSTRGADILLCPLMKSRFNSCRSESKFFDAARLGAVGMYSNRSPYKGFVRDGIDGLLLDDAHDDWIACIKRLAGDEETCREIATNCRSRATLITRDS